ncbi:MAG: hypothetical protein ACOC33_03975 [bacterium]
MTNEEKLSKALQVFKTKYPSITNADLQTFIIGWQEAVKNCFIPDVSYLLAFCEWYKTTNFNCEGNPPQECVDEYLKANCG